MINDETRVKVAEVLTPRDYNHAWANRRQGATGLVVGHSNSHGLMFQVKHDGDGSFGYYDEDELTQFTLTVRVASDVDVALGTDRSAELVKEGRKLQRAIRNHGNALAPQQRNVPFHEDLMVTPEMLIKCHRRKFVDRVQHYLNELMDDDNPSHCIGHIESECDDYTRIIKDAIGNPMDERQSQRREFNDEFPWAVSLSDEQRVALLNWISDFIDKRGRDEYSGPDLTLYNAFAAAITKL